MNWSRARIGRLFTERDERGFVDLPMLSVSQRLGVVPQAEVDGGRTFWAHADVAVCKRTLPGDLVYNKMRMWQGAVGLTRVAGLVSPDYVVARPTADVEPRYYAYLFRTPLYLHEFAKYSRGLVDDRNRLYWDEFKAIEVPYPPLAVQEEIADFLDLELSDIALLSERKEVLRQLLAERRRAVIDAETSTGDPTRLMYVNEPARPIMYGIVLPGPHVSGGVPIVKGGDVAVGRLTLDSLNRTDPEIESRYVRSRLRGGDLLITIRGSVGELAIVPDALAEANITQDAARIAPATGTDARWLRYALTSSAAQAQMAERTTGATVRGLNIMDLKRVVIRVPSEPAQRLIADALDDAVGRIDALIERLKQQGKFVTEHRQSLITAAVTGQIERDSGRGEPESVLVGKMS